MKMAKCSMCGRTQDHEATIVKGYRLVEYCDECTKAHRAEVIPHQAEYRRGAGGEINHYPPQTD